jgi:hypothetical protein
MQQNKVEPKNIAYAQRINQGSKDHHESILHEI